MEEKKSKVKLSTVVCVFIILAIIITLGAVYYFGSVADGKDGVNKENTTNITENILTENESKEENVISNNEEDIKKLDEEDEDLHVFLSNASYLNAFNDNEDNISENYTKESFDKGVKLQMAALYVQNKMNNEDMEEANKYQYSKEDINTAIKEIFNEEITEVIESDFAMLKYDNSINKYAYEFGGDTGYSTYIVEIENQEYSEGIYKVTFLYAYPSEGDLIDGNIDDYNCYRTTIELKINDDYIYSKYQVVNTMSMSSEKVGK